MVALVAVSSAIYAIDRPYSYRIPEGADPVPGVRVIVPFGRGNRRCEGIILDITQTEEAGLKSIEQILDTEPILTPEFIRMAAFMRERYFCTFYDAVKAILPAGVWFDTDENFTRTEKDASRSRLQELERRILQCFEEQSVISRKNLKAAFEGEAGVDEAVLKLLRNKYLHSDFDFSQRIHDKTEDFAELAVPVEQAMEYAQKRKRSAPLQCELLTLLTAVGSGSVKELCYLSGATRQTVRKLEDLGLLQVYSRDVFRSTLPTYVEPAAPIVLTQEQNSAFEGLSQQCGKPAPGVSLLYGITGSGKTSVYIRLIQQALSAGKGALYLVPEISLTPQLIGLLMSHFGDTVAVLHSALRVSERYDTWKKIRQGTAKVVIGTRSAIFAPVSNLGIIIVDEEQEHTYKSENSPRYHAREIAIYRGQKENALVLLGSATPSVETMFLAKSGIYSFYRLCSRYNGKALPQVEIVDMKEDIRRGNSSDISLALRGALQENLNSGKQSILFLNRRGAARCMVCVDCGDVRQCPGCSVSLTYHRANNRLMCHHCGYSEPAEDTCPKCGGHRKSIGTGTQKIEEDLHRFFPDVQTIRMDADTVCASNTHEMILNRFRDENIPILIGTQMVTKGLNFENVTLVGIVDADTSLYANHYRAAESTFSMLTQVIGRAGRGSFAGRAIIQTMTPEHTVIGLAAKQDYDSFYDLEITLRQLQHCPPYGDIFSCTFTSLYEESAIAAAYDFKHVVEQMTRGEAVSVLGPSPAAVAKVNHNYRYKVSILCSNSKALRLSIASALKEFGKNKRYKGVSVYADINAYE